MLLSISWSWVDFIFIYNQWHCLLQLELVSFWNIWNHKEVGLTFLSTIAADLEYSQSLSLVPSDTQTYLQICGELWYKLSNFVFLQCHVYKTLALCIFSAKLHTSPYNLWMYMQSLIHESKYDNLSYLKIVVAGVYLAPKPCTVTANISLSKSALYAVLSLFTESLLREQQNDISSLSKILLAKTRNRTWTARFASKLSTNALRGKRC